MKQMILLEPEDLAALRHGESRTLQVGATSIVLGYAGPVLGRNGARPVPATGEAKAPSSVENRTCPTCQKVLGTRKYMFQHHRREHGKTLGAPGGRSIACPECEARFPTFQQVRSHLKNGHHAATKKLRRRACPRCGERVQSSAMGAHMRHHHPKRGAPNAITTANRQQVQAALAQTGGNKTKAAQMLGVDRNTIARALKKEA